MTGADASQEWILPWWYEHYHRHSDLPVVFADFGMSPEMVGWCKQRGRVVEVPGEGHAWFRKPMAWLKSPYQYTLWLDADCEVVADAAGLFDGHDGRRMYVIEDPVAFRGMNGGTVVIPHGHPVAVDSARELLRCGKEGYRGDQESLHPIQKRYPELFQFMPKDWVWFRAVADAEVGRFIRHWTGPAGKEHIRKQIEAKKDEVLA